MNQTIGDPAQSPDGLLAVGQVDSDGDSAPRRFPSMIPSIVATVVFPPLGLVSLAGAVGYRRSVREGRPSVAQAVRARDWATYAFGAALTTLIVGALAAFLLLNDHAVLRAYFDLDALKTSIPEIGGAFLGNLYVSIIAEIGIVIWSLILVVGRSIPGRAYLPIRLIVVGYIDLFRALPGLLTILLIGFGLPATGIEFFAGMSLYQTGAIALVIVYGAYVAEIFRGAIDAIPSGQLAAARSLGFGYFGAMRHIILPQAIRATLPSLLNWYISVLKDTSLLSVLGLVEGLTTARIQVTFMSNLSPLVGVSLCFLIVTLPLSRLTDYIIVRSARKRQGKA
ncbi:amino acid ABC transporter permease [Streptosporangium sp. NPDC006007]|uniref:amino acid ABC transporter permease n=1 Tax=Streptosporangium sp. NPDC006007 TaxID=3154575 RepID=UPI0033AEA58C